MVSNNIQTSSTYEATKNSEYLVSNNITIIGSYIVPAEGENNYISSQSYASSINYGPKAGIGANWNTADENLEDGAAKKRANMGGVWGTGSNDTHFVNYAYSASGGPNNLTGSHTFYNWDHWEIRDTFLLIGDVESVSGSKYLTGNAHAWETKFDNHKNFLNREIRDKGKSYIYKSYIVADGGDPETGLTYEGRIDGRPVGRTSFYVTRSTAVGGDGDFVYPVNHWINFVDDMRTNFHNGYQNGEIVTYENGAFTYDSSHLKPFPHSIWEDVSSASFYSVDVGDYSDIVAKRGLASLTKNTQGKITRIK